MSRPTDKSERKQYGEGRQARLMAIGLLVIIVVAAAMLFARALMA